MPKVSDLQSFLSNYDDRVHCIRTRLNITLDRITPYLWYGVNTNGTSFKYYAGYIEVFTPELEATELIVKASVCYGAMDKDPAFRHLKLPQARNIRIVRICDPLDIRDANLRTELASRLSCCCIDLNKKLAPKRQTYYPHAHLYLGGHSNSAHAPLHWAARLVELFRPLDDNGDPVALPSDSPQSQIIEIQSTDTDISMWL